MRMQLAKTGILLVMVIVAAHASAQDSNWAVFVMKPDGSQARKVVQAGSGDHSSPRWSHDGKQIAFDAVTTARGKREVYVVNADGTGLRSLGSDARPDWSPDDKQLAYDLYSQQPSVFVQNLDGTGQTEIAAGVCGRWSPDGSQLAVTDHKNLRIIDLVSGEARELFDTPFDNIYGGYNWSPDGRYLALTAQTKAAGGGARPLLIVDVAAKPARSVVRMRGGQGGSVSWSPDGKQLAIDNKYLIWLLEVSGTSTPRVIPGQKGQNKDPHWSSDGEWIVFCSDRD